MDKLRSTLKQLVRDWSEEVGVSPFLGSMAKSYADFPLIDRARLNGTSATNL